MVKPFFEKLLLYLTDKNKMDIVEDLRVNAVLPFLKGKVLDIGCGYNNLVKKYSGDGVGVDVFNWNNQPNIIVERTDKLPLDNDTFDTVTFLASLNHIPYRDTAIKEASRVLKNDGQIIITMIGPTVGKIAHFFDGKDEVERGFI